MSNGSLPGSTLVSLGQILWAAELSWDAMLKMTNVKLELMSDIDM